MAGGSPLGGAVPMTAFEKQLGRYLLENRAITREQIQTVMEAARSEGWSFLQALINLKYVGDEVVRHLMGTSAAELSPADLKTLESLDLVGAGGGASPGSSAKPSTAAPILSSLVLSPSPSSSSSSSIPLVAPGGTFIDGPGQQSAIKAAIAAATAAKGSGTFARPHAAPAAEPDAHDPDPGGESGVKGLKRRRLGEYLLEDKVIDKDQLHQALEYARTNEVQLGAALVSLKYVDEDKLSEYILRQRSDLQKIVRRAKKLKLGDLLLKRGKVDERKLQDALSFAMANGLRLGESLVRRGFVNERDVAEALSEQLLIPHVSLKRSPPDPTIVNKVPKRLCYKHKVIPYRQEGKVMTIAMVDPVNIIALDDFQQITGLATVPVIITQSDFDQAAKNFLGGGDDQDSLLEVLSENPQGGGEGVHTGMTGEFKMDGQAAPIIKMVHKIIGAAFTKGASDIHIEPQEQVTLVRLRVDGVLRELMKLPREFHAAIMGRLKVMCQCDIAECRLPQDGKFRLKVGKNVIDFRASFLPLMTGEKAVMRLLDQSRAKITVDSLGLERTAYRNYFECLHVPHGIVLVCGPTGSGKTTSLYAGLLEINNPRINIHTVEDPIEYNIPGITQVQVDPGIKRTFAAVLRAFLRQDPNVILVGEIRDSETASIALKSAMTGHLVLSTLHTNDATGAIDRLISMGVDRFLMATAIRLVMAQRLLRRLCYKCREPLQLTEAEWAELPLSEFLLGEAGMEGTPRDQLQVYRPVGCDQCADGHRGRTGIYECLRPDDTLSEMIVTGASNFEMWKYARDHLNMLTLLESALVKFVQGDTSLDEFKSMGSPQLSRERREQYRMTDLADEVAVDASALAKRVDETQEQVRSVAALMGTLAERLAGGGASGAPAEDLAQPMALLSRLCRESLHDPASPAARVKLGKLATFLDELNTWYAKPRPTRNPVNLHTLITTEVLDKLGTLASKAFFVADRAVDLTAFTVTQQLEPLDRVVSVDWPNVKRVLQQLLMNSLVALAPGGQLKVSGRVTAGERSVELQVLDTGAGMAPEVAERAARPFFTLHPDALGLGLAIADKLARAMGGRLEIQSKQGKGCLVTLEVPLGEADAT